MLADFARLSIRIAAKDLRLLFRDRVGMALSFLLPIALVAVFGAVFGSIGGDDDSALPRQRLCVADLDRSEASARFVGSLGGTGLVAADTADGKEPYTRERLLAAVRKGRIAVAVVVPAGFGQSLAQAQMPALELIRDPAREVERQIAGQAVFAALMESHGDRIARVLAQNGIGELGESLGLGPASKEDLGKLVSGFFDRLDEALRNRSDRQSRPSGRDSSRPHGRPQPGGFRGPASLVALRETVAVGEGEGGNAGGARGAARRAGQVSQSVSGTAVMMLLFGLAACGGTLLREREEGTLRRLLLTPAPRGAILAGKFLFTFVIGMLQIAVMFGFGAAVFALPIGRHPLGLLIVSAALCAAATGFGVFIATVGRTQRQVDGIATLIILLMSAMGGSWFPLFLMPKWMQVAGHFTLNAWAMDAYQDLFWRNLPIREVLPEVGVLLGVAAVLCTLSVWFFQRRFAGTDAPA